MPEILNKKQLEDAIKCRGFGTGCCDKNKKHCSAGGVGICIENAAYTALAYREMLEFITSTLDEIMTDYYGTKRREDCPLKPVEDKEVEQRECNKRIL